jgi:hypothetical protein
MRRALLTRMIAAWNGWLIIDFYTCDADLFC